jgi:hypothetical protein
MTTDSVDLLGNGRRSFALWGTIALQQAAFSVLCQVRIALLGLSEWVIYAPILIIWALYLATPLLTVARSDRPALLRSYALFGWIFVAAAMAWIITYLLLSGKYGTPVSNNWVMELLRRLKAARQH